MPLLRFSEQQSPAYSQSNSDLSSSTMFASPAAHVPIPSLQSQYPQLSVPYEQQDPDNQCELSSILSHTSLLQTNSNQPIPTRGISFPIPLIICPPKQSSNHPIPIQQKKLPSPLLATKSRHTYRQPATTADIPLMIYFDQQILLQSLEKSSFFKVNTQLPLELFQLLSRLKQSELRSFFQVPGTTDVYVFETVPGFDPHLFSVLSLPSPWEEVSSSLITDLFCQFT
jgi:hypothetical protein